MKKCIISRVDSKNPSLELDNLIRVSKTNPSEGSYMLTEYYFVTENNREKAKAKTTFVSGNIATLKAGLLARMDSNKVFETKVVNPTIIDPKDPRFGTITKELAIAGQIQTVECLESEPIKEIVDYVAYQEKKGIKRETSILTKVKTFGTGGPVCTLEGTRILKHTRFVESQQDIEDILIAHDNGAIGKAWVAQKKAAAENNPAVTSPVVGSFLGEENSPF